MIGVSQQNLIVGGEMRNLLILGVLILVAAAPSWAQEYPKAEVFGGYQYLRLNPGGANCHGFGGSATRNLNYWLPGATDFGYSKVTVPPPANSPHAGNSLFEPTLTSRASRPPPLVALVPFRLPHF